MVDNPHLTSLKLYSAAICTVYLYKLWTLSRVLKILDVELNAILTIHVICQCRLSVWLSWANVPQLQFCAMMSQNAQDRQAPDRCTGIHSVASPRRSHSQYEKLAGITKVKVTGPINLWYRNDEQWMRRYRIGGESASVPGNRGDADRILVGRPARC